MSDSFFLKLLLHKDRNWHKRGDLIRLVSLLEGLGFRIQRSGSTILAKSYSRGDFVDTDLDTAVDRVERGVAGGIDIGVSRPPFAASISFHVPTDVGAPLISVMVQRVNLSYEGETDEDRQYQRECVEGLMDLGVQLCLVYRPQIGFGDIESTFHDGSEHPAAVFERTGSLPRAYWSMYFPDPRRDNYAWVGELNDAEVRPVDELGYLIRLSANPYYGWIHNRFRAEIRLGVVAADLAVYERLLRHFETKRREDPEGLARTLGFEKETMEMGRRVARMAGLADDAWLNFAASDWEIFARRTAIRAAGPEYELDPQDEDRIEGLFREFVETYRSS